MPDDAFVVFTPSGRRGRFPVGTTILQAARALGVDLDSVCGGRGICGRCQVVQSVGTFAKHGIESAPIHLSPVSEVEDRYASENPLAQGRRLGCSTAVLGNVVVDVPPESQVHRQVVRKRVEVHDIEMNPMVHLHFVEVQEPDMHDPASDLRRLKEALEFEWRLARLDCDPDILPGLQDTLRAGDWNVTVAIYDETQHRCRMAGLQGSRSGARGGRWFDHGSGPSVRSLDRGGRRLLGSDEPPDPLR